MSPREELERWHVLMDEPLLDLSDRPARRRRPATGKDGLKRHGALR